MGIRFDERKIYNLQLRRISDLNKRLYQLFVDSRDKALTDLLKYRSSVVRGGIIQPFKEKRFINLINEINKNIADLTGKSFRAVSAGFKNTLESTYYLEAYAVEKAVNTSLGLSASYSLRLPKLNEKFIQAAFDKRIGGMLLKDRVKRIRNAVQFNVQEAVAQNIIEGQTVKSLSKNLKLINKVYDAGFKSTQRIARTELLKAYSIGQDEMRVEAEKSGVEFNYIWSATLDSKVRPDHARADQKPPYKFVDEKPVWSIGGVDMVAPRLPLVETGSRLEAKQVINCRCRRLNIPLGSG
jgi:hypothetical protein